MADDQRPDEAAADTAAAAETEEAEGQLSEDDIAAVVGGIEGPITGILGEAGIGEAL